jgi:hypothetical protein
MPTYIRPARVEITEGGGLSGLVLILVTAGAVGAVVLFIAAHIELLAVCVCAFVTVMGGLAAWSRWLASPKRFRQRHYPGPAVRIDAARLVQALSAPRRKAIGARELRPHPRGLSAEEVTATIERSRREQS